MFKFIPFPELSAAALALVATVSLTQRLPAQDPPDDEAHAQVRKQIAEAKKKEDPKKETPVSRETAAERPAPKPKKNKGDKKTEDAKSDDKKSNDKDSEDEKSKDPAPSVTHGSRKTDGQTIRETAAAGRMVMKNDEGDPTAHVFDVAYAKRPERRSVNREAAAERDDAKKGAASKADSTRPITFVFNG